ncbi:DEAD/DEAH box helicase [bacterium]|nr:DEAD/DEAH box helicase [bacterium]
MSQQGNNIFEKFKQTPFLSNKGKPVSSLFFQLCFFNNSSNLLVVDEKGSEIKVDYRDFTGTTRDILKAIDFIRGKGKFNIQWDKKQVGVNLADNGFLLWQLKKCGNFVDENLKPIEFVDESGDLIVIINGDQQLECKLALQCNGECLKNIKFVNENHVLSNGKIYPTTPTGADYSLITSFETLIFPAELEKYLSLLFSYCSNISIQYRDFKIIDGRLETTKASLVFEKVAQDNTLYLRVSNTLSGFEPGFFDMYDITKAVIVNEQEKSIVISDVIHADIYSSCKKIERILNRLKKEQGAFEDSSFYQDENLFIIEDPLAETLVQNELPGMISDFIIFGSAQLEFYKVKMVKPEVALSIDHGIDFFEGDVDLTIEGEVFSLFEALHQFRKNSYVQLNDGTRALLDPEYIQKLERVFQRKKDRFEISFFDLPLVEELIDAKTSEGTFGASREFFQRFNGLKDLDIAPPEINAVYRPYQVEGYKWLKYLQEHSLGACLADDMGLGKTLQAIALLSSIYPTEKSPSLIILPKSLVFNWQAELEKFNPDLTFYVHYGPERDIEKGKKHHVILTTYATVRNDIETLKEELFYYLILDESQTIKNTDSQISRAVTLLKGSHRLALSGTPIENNLGELYSLFRFLNPTMFGSLAKFSRDYLYPIQQHGNKKSIEELRKKIFPFIMRRLKKDVLKDLPEKIEQILYVDMSPEQKKFYEQRRSFYFETIRNQIKTEGIKKSQFFILQAITVLRQIASIPELKSEGQIISPKREMLLERIIESVANGHKILLFANFLGILDFLAEDLNKYGIDYETLTGATRDREIPVKRFQSDPRCMVFLMTLKTGGQGLNLTAADTIYIYDPWWNIAAENQAIDRSHRMGQDKTVFSYKLISKGTIEEKILTLQKKKRALFENIISTDSISTKYLNIEDIDYILG